MPKLVKQFKENKLTLIVELPKNDLEHAEAAVKGGADAIQLSVADLAAEKDGLIRILRSVKLPVGLMLKGKRLPGQAELRSVLKTGFDFVNISRDNLPDYFKDLKGVAKILGLGNRFTIDLVLGIGEHGVDAVDAAIMPSSECGKNLIVGDLQNYISIVISAGIPVIIPTQRAIKPSEVAIIADTEARGLLLTPVVLGTTVKHVQDNVREFRVAVDDLG
jgi:hypothetical protein